MNKTPDFIAALQYLTTEQGGRKTPAFTNYFPQLKFKFSEYQCGGQQKFIDKQVVNPGEHVTAEIALLSTEPFENKLNVGFEFDIKEGSKIVGTGIILQILNERLIAQ